MNYDIDHKSTYDMEATDVGIKESINIDRSKLISLLIYILVILYYYNNIV